MKQLMTQQAYPVSALCAALGVSRSGYYGWLGRGPSQRAQLDERLKVWIRAIHQASRHSYGTRRVHRQLHAQGQPVGRDRVGRLRRQMGLQSLQRRSWRISTTDSAHELPVAQNLLAQHFQANAVDRVWLSDITYVRTAQGWLYLAGLKDLHSCEIVGYAMSERMTVQLTLDALNHAHQARKPAKGLILHSDRGSQYCAHEYRRRVDKLGLRASMSRRGNCYDNAPMESFWGSLKTELIHHRQFATRDEARAAITEWIEVFYNRQRLHSRLGYLAPAEFARRARNAPATPPTH
jgi:transposase InsO family protein